MNTEILLAGFGGQGILFAGKVLAYCGMIDGKNVSWLPSYGPEMRGGTANCSVCISDEPIGSPLITEPTILIAMNAPSYTKFIDRVKPGGKVLFDSTLIENPKLRDYIEIKAVNSTAVADENGISGMANMVMLGKLICDTCIFTLDTLKKALEKCVPAQKKHLIEYNLKALNLGMTL